MNRPAIKYAMSKLSGDNLILAEIGIALGKNSIEMIREFKQIKMIMLIDPFSPYGNGRDNCIETAATQALNKEKMLKNIAPYADKLIFYEKDSLTAAQIFPENYFDFVYIDGNHQYEFVKADIAFWWTSVRPGGFLAGHDYNANTGVKQAVDEFCVLKNVDVKTFAEGKVTTANSDWIIHKCK